MTLTVNGNEQAVNDGLSLVDLLVQMDLDPDQKGIAVAVNAEVISHSVWRETQLKDGDRVDIIHAVQGG